MSMRSDWLERAAQEARARGFATREGRGGDAARGVVVVAEAHAPAIREAVEAYVRALAGREGGCLVGLEHYWGGPGDDLAGELRAALADLFGPWAGHAQGGAGYAGLLDAPGVAAFGLEDREIFLDAVAVRDYAATVEVVLHLIVRAGRLDVRGRDAAVAREAVAGLRRLRARRPGPAIPALDADLYGFASSVIGGLDNGAARVFNAGRRAFFERVLDDASGLPAPLADDEGVAAYLAGLRATYVGFLDGVAAHVLHRRNTAMAAHVARYAAASTLPCVVVVGAQHVFADAQAMTTLRMPALRVAEALELPRLLPGASLVVRAF
ncbi:MAG: hypothetical protein AB7E47_03020 [Desulfovibrionaceae bacterium]